MLQRLNISDSKNDNKLPFSIFHNERITKSNEFLFLICYFSKLIIPIIDSHMEKKKQANFHINIFIVLVDPCLSICWQAGWSCVFIHASCVCNLFEIQKAIDPHLASKTASVVNKCPFLQLLYAP